MVYRSLCNMVLKEVEFHSIRARFLMGFLSFSITQQKLEVSIVKCQL